jgi:hypothetical protein
MVIRKSFYCKLNLFSKQILSNSRFFNNVPYMLGSAFEVLSFTEKYKNWNSNLIAFLSEVEELSKRVTNMFIYSSSLNFFWKYFEGFLERIEFWEIW